MVRWVCPQDRTGLVREEGGWSCTECGRRYVVVDDIVVFSAKSASEPPVAEELWSGIVTSSLARAAEAFCTRHGCSRPRFSANWRSFFSPRPGGATLEIGGGLGDDTIELARSSGSVIVLAPGLTRARIIKHNLDENGVTNASVAVVTDLARLPLEDASIDAVCMEDTAAGFDLSSGNLEAAATEWKRIVTPGGSVFLGVANTLHRLPGLDRLRSMLRARPPAPSLNRFLKHAGGGGRLGLQELRRRLAAAGFQPSDLYAPLPDPDDAQIVLPVEDRNAVRYFLNNLIRKNSPAVRLAIRAANLLVGLNLFRHGVPYYYLIFRDPS